MPQPSSTFHGRNIFAPAVAYLAHGVPLRCMRPPVEDLMRFPLPVLAREPGPALRGEILHPDRFGNGLTNIGRLQAAGGELPLASWLPGCPAASLPLEGLRAQLPDGRAVPFARTFTDVAAGEAPVYAGCTGLLDVGVNQRRADTVLSLTPGDVILLLSKG